MLARAGVTVVHAAEALLGWSALAELRDEVGPRGPVHSAEKLVAWFGAQRFVVGYSHQPYRERLLGALALLGARQAIAVLQRAPDRLRSAGRRTRGRASGAASGLGLRLGLRATLWRVAATIAGLRGLWKSPISRHFLRWRDPDSNRGHHDFQQLLAPDDRAGPRQPPLPFAERSTLPERAARDHGGHGSPTRR
jgi:hypothetical protein